MQAMARTFPMESSETSGPRHLIRRIIREELVRIVKKDPNMFYLDPEMPIYKDMEEIKQRKLQGNIELSSHDEVWGE